MGAQSSKKSTHTQRRRSSSLDLNKVNVDELTSVPYENQLVNFRVIGVYDGDTIDGIMAIGKQPVKIAIRLAGIDTPEIRAGKGKFEIEKKAGLLAKERLKALLKDGQIQIVIHEWDKYGGRIVADVITAEGHSAAAILIKEGYGKPYDGKKAKEPWTFEELMAPPFI